MDDPSTMPDLTLEQVKEAGRFAVLGIPDSDMEMFVPGHGFYGYDVWGDVLAAVDDPTERDAYGHGWHHLPGCDCPFCRP